MGFLHMSIALALLALTVLLGAIALRSRARAAHLRTALAARDKQIVSLQDANAALNRQLRAYAPKPRRRDDWVDYIRTYEFPAGMLQRALATCPAGTDAVLVERGLREFLATIGAAPQGQVAMCSTTVDEAWHTFITYTRDYAAFCDDAFGGFRHHVPQDPAAVPATGGTGVDLVSAWLGACAYEDLDPLNTSSAPALFASDEVAGLGARTVTGTCGAVLDDDTQCVAVEGQVCLVHRYASAFETLTSAGVFDALVPGRPRGASSARPKSTRRRATSGRGRSTSAAATSSAAASDSGYMTSVLAYHAVMSPPVEDCSSTTDSSGSASTSSSYSSCGSSSYSSCSSSSGSSSSGSSCSSSSCGSC